MDSKIWTKESDRYTSRAIKSHEGELYSVDKSYSEKISDCISTYTNNPKKILDVELKHNEVNIVMFKIAKKIFFMKIKIPYLFLIKFYIGGK